MISFTKQIIKKAIPEQLFINALKIMDKKQYLGGGIPYLVLSVGHACTLKCKNCGNFCHSAKPEMKRYDLSDLKGDMQNILDCVNFINELQIQGGEPFIYSDLKDLIEFLASEKKIKHITIATNGTVIPKDDLIEVIKQHNVCIRISNYPIVREKGLILQNKFIETGVNYTIYKFDLEKDEWFYLGGIDTPRENDDFIVSRRFWYCGFKGCLTLDNGELNWCSRIVNAHSLQGFKRRDDDHVNVRDIENLKKRIWNFINHKKFPEACRYCHGTYKADKIIPAEQLTRND